MNVMQMLTRIYAAVAVVLAIALVSCNSDINGPNQAVQSSALMSTQQIAGTGTPASPLTLSDNEKLAIDLWLQKHSNSLNQFGDPKGTMYLGGTPLFNERTGQRMDKYDYIVQQHPDRPWLNEEPRP